MTQKLYTEEQVVSMLDRARMHKQDDTEMFTNEYLLSQATPIELPTYNDIINEAYQKPKCFYDNSHRDIFIEGCAWVVVNLREKYEQIIFSK